MEELFYKSLIIKDINFKKQMFIINKYKLDKIHKNKFKSSGILKTKKENKKYASILKNIDNLLDNLNKEKNINI